MLVVLPFQLRINVGKRSLHRTQFNWVGVGLFSVCQTDEIIIFFLAVTEPSINTECSSGPPVHSSKPCLNIWGAVFFNYWFFMLSHLSSISISSVPFCNALYCKQYMTDNRAHPLGFQIFLLIGHWKRSPKSNSWIMTLMTPTDNESR